MQQDYPDSVLLIQILVLESIDASQDMARYYVLSIEPTLFGDTAMVREWGRIGRTGQRRIELYAQHDGARSALGWSVSCGTAIGFGRFGVARERPNTRLNSRR